MKVLVLAIPAGILSACRTSQAHYVDRYRGDFVYSWEGGGFFIPCDAGPNQPRAGLGRRFFNQLHADSIHWPAGVAPDRTREGAVTFLVLRTPLLVRTSGDTLEAPFGAQVDSVRARLPNDCGGAP